MVRVALRRLILAAIAASFVGVPTVLTTSSASAATTPVAQAAAVNWPTVRPGARGERVWTIQLSLQQRGYSLLADGLYGTATTNAVKAFQRARGLPVDGRVGPLTWPRLVFTVTRGNRGPAVRAFERWLRLVYRYDVLVDGTFGPRDQAAIRNVQFNHGLRVDGIVGPATWKVLLTG